MNLEYMEWNRRTAFMLRLKQRLFGMYERDAGLWRYAIASMWALCCAATALVALGMPTGLGAAFDVLIGMVLNTIALAITSVGTAALLAIAGARVPRYTVGCLLYMGVLVYFILYYSEFGWRSAIVFSVLFTILAAGLGLLIGWLMRLRAERRRLVLVLGGGIVLVALYAILGFPQLLPAMSGAVADDAAADHAEWVSLASTSDLPDPSETGKYAYHYFTYGSGEDRHRSEFGAETDELSTTVDASDYIDNWSWLRGQFWGFDEKRLPLNGRVWMPEGDGPFPLVLIVHGNHLMEKFSDEGYGYLGELLASRGFIAISIDENFLNYSVWSGIPGQDMKLRAWMLLKHIQLLQSFNQQEGSLFYDHIDFSRIALLGHSRGGQAAAMAAERSSWFANDDSLPEADSYSIQAVIALAPTDTVIDGKLTELQDVSYLTLQGAKDADLVNFYGDRQYGRTSFIDKNKGALKASLYIGDANHSQFNTSWGQSDNAYPAGLFIRPKDKLTGEQQRTIAKVYVSAFLETVFHRSELYDPMFRDYRTALPILPETHYFSRYENDRFLELADFEGDEQSELSDMASADANQLVEWVHEEAKDRQNQGKGNNGVVLEWEHEGSYSVTVNEPELDTDEDTVVFVSMADLRRELEETEAMPVAELSVEVEVKDRSGVAVRLPLDKFVSLQPIPVASFTWVPTMESVISDGKFKEDEEPVFQTIEMPLQEFVEEDEDFSPAEWTELTFYFDGGPGRVMLDDLGLLL